MGHDGTAAIVLMLGQSDALVSRYSPALGQNGTHRPKFISVSAQVLRKGLESTISGYFISKITIYNDKYDNFRARSHFP